MATKTPSMTMPTRMQSSPSLRVVSAPALWHGQALTTETRPERPEEGADVLDQRRRLFEGREVPAGQHVGPMLDVVRLLGEAAHGGDNVIGEGRHPCRHLDAPWRRRGR